MRFFLIPCLLLVSLTTYAQGLRRVTTITCTNEEAQKSYLVQWDGTPFPSLIQYNGVDEYPLITFGKEMVFSNRPSESTYSITLLGEKRFKTLLKLEGQDIEMSCQKKREWKIH